MKISEYLSKVYGGSWRYILDENGWRDDDNCSRKAIVTGDSLTVWESVYLKPIQEYDHVTGELSQAISRKPESTHGTTAEPGSALRGLRFPEGVTVESSPHAPDGSLTLLRGGPLKRGSLWFDELTGETKQWNGFRWVAGPPTKITVQPDGTKVVTVIRDAPGGCTVEGRIVPPKEGA